MHLISDILQALGILWAVSLIVDSQSDEPKSLRLIVMQRLLALVILFIAVGGL